MTALSADRDTKRRDGVIVRLPVAASTKIYAGAKVARNASGYAVPASDTAGLVVVGRAEEQVDNSNGANGDKYVDVRRGVFAWANGASFSRANIGQECYVADDQTVTNAAGSTNKVYAGIIVEVDSDGVWVATGAWGKVAGPIVLDGADDPLGSASVADPAAMTSTDVTTANADATYGQEEADLINEIKADYNALRADVTALRNTVVSLLAELRKTNGCGVLND